MKYHADIRRKPAARGAGGNPCIVYCITNSIISELHSIYLPVHQNRPPMSPTSTTSDATGRCTWVQRLVARPAADHVVATVQVHLYGISTVVIGGWQ
jgi:hypothetical protein